MNFQNDLVIDGDINFGEEIKKMLALHKYHVCYASIGASGIQKAFEYNPDLKLYDVDIDPTDGCQVYKLLKDDLVTSIEILLQKYKTRRSEVVSEFNTLFQLSPNGIIVFNEHDVLRANQSILRLLKIDKQEYLPIKIEDLFEHCSLVRIKSWIQQSVKVGNLVFNETITIKNTMDEELKMNLLISEFSNSPNIVQFIGFFTPITKENSYLVNDQLASQVCHLLKREKIAITDDLEEKIIHTIKQRTIRFDNQNNSFFTKRENQVLCLSMEGLPIKMIAEKLAISSRTVEKYRTKLIEKSGANNLVEVIVFSLKNGLIKI